MHRKQPIHTGVVIVDMELEGLQAELSTAYINFFQVIKQLDPDKRRQSGVTGDWSPKDVISHLVGWDKALQGFIVNPDGFDPNPLFDINTFNAKSVSKRQHQSWEETIDELQSSYIDLEKAIATVTAEMKIYERVSGWLKGRREDYEHHKKQMEEWIEQNSKA